VVEREEREEELGVRRRSTYLRDAPASVAIAESGNKTSCLIFEATILSITNCSYVDHAQPRISVDVYFKQVFL